MTIESRFSYVTIEVSKARDTMGLLSADGTVVLDRDGDGLTARIYPVQDNEFRQLGVYPSGGVGLEVDPVDFSRVRTTLERLVCGYVTNNVTATHVLALATFAPLFDSEVLVGPVGDESGSYREALTFDDWSSFSKRDWIRRLWDGTCGTINDLSYTSALRVLKGNHRGS